ncbi:methyl-accepting chemotaxis protein [Granulosicoccus antarcticus]|nr:methyl-accepting chemotaxis protein [Granulosicoccus antarcticus]
MAVLVLVGMQVDGARKSNIKAVGILAEVQATQLSLRDVQTGVEQLAREGREVLLRDNDASAENFRAAFQSHKELLQVKTQDLQSRSLEPSMSNELQRTLDSIAQLTDKYETAMQALLSGSSGDPIRLLRNVGETSRTTVTMIDGIVNDYSRQLKELQLRQESITNKKNRLFAFTVVLILLGVSTILWAFIRWHLIKPLKTLLDVAIRLSEDEVDISIQHSERTDELGLLARALKIFKRNRISELELLHANEQNTVQREQRIKEEFEDRRHAGENELREREKQQAMQRADESAASEQLLQLRIDRLSMGVSAAAGGDLSYLAKNPCENLHLNDALAHMTLELESLFSQFGQDFGRIKLDAQNVNLSALQLEELGKSIDEGANLNNTQTLQVLQGAQTVRDVLLEVSQSVDRMETGIRGISDNASQASSVASQAVELARSTDGTMRTLSESSQDIGKVIKLITSVAEQTNLLALNATIEAARAGDAGKGFAVVANEVKELAKETNKATDEIQARIAAIRKDTDQAVEAIGSINEIVSEIDGLQTSISESVKVQSDTAHRITTLVGNATGDNQSVTTILDEVVERQHSTQQAAAKVRQSSEELRSSAEGNVKLTARYRI